MTAKSIKKFFKECDALLKMVDPLGSVSAQEYKRLLSVAKQYRKICTSNLGSHEYCHPSVPKAKKVIDIETTFVKWHLENGEYEAADAVIKNLESKYGSITPVVQLRGRLNLLRFPTDAD